jgi:AraC family transcriptional regulator
MIGVPHLEVAMDKKASPKADKTAQTSPEAPFTTFIELDGKSPVPSQFRTPGTFTITRLQSPAGLPNRITKLSPVPALLVSIFLKSLPSSSYQVWTSDKLVPTSIVHPFRSNVIDFDSQPRCWAGCAFDYVHYSVPRHGLDDIAEDLGFGRVNNYRLAVLEDDLVVAQITKSILPFLGRRDGLSVLALDQFSLILGAHLIQQYGVLQKTTRRSKGGLAPWQKRRASEILHENMHGGIRLSDIARDLVRNASETPLAQGLALERNLFLKLCISESALARMRSYEEQKITSPSRSIEVETGSPNHE